jgi:hypothetical protein
MHYHIKGCFIIGLLFGTLTWWYLNNDFPKVIASVPHINFAVFDSINFFFSKSISTLLFNLVFLYILTLNGLARSLSDLGGLTNQSGSIPRGNWLFIVCGKRWYT